MNAEKTYVFGDTTGNGALGMLAPLLSQRGIDTGALLAMNRGGFGMNGFGDLIGLIVAAGIFGGFNGNGGLFGNGNNNGVSDLIVSTLNRNGLDISQLSSTIHCSTDQINAGINNVATQICQLAGQQGLSAQQIINAVLTGQNQISAQLASCCCDLKTTAERGFSSIAFETAQQTCALRGEIKDAALAITGRIDNLEKTSLLDKIDKLREEKSTLTTQLNLEHQNAYFAQVSAQTIAPVTATLTDLSKRLAEIECKQPATVTIPYIPAMGSVVPVNYSVPVNFGISTYGCNGCGYSN